MFYNVEPNKKQIYNYRVHLLQSNMTTHKSPTPQQFLTACFVCLIFSQTNQKKSITEKSNVTSHLRTVSTSDKKIICQSYIGERLPFMVKQSRERQSSSFSHLSFLLSNQLCKEIKRLQVSSVPAISSCPVQSNQFDTETKICQNSHDSNIE